MIAKTSNDDGTTSPIDIIHANHASSRRTYILPLTFPSISQTLPLLTRMSYGTDIWELRADLLSLCSSPLGASNLPPLQYVKEQLSLLQLHSDLPVLFTIRTVSQGGKFPDDASKEALEMILAAVEAGCEYIDVEIDWPQAVVDEIVSKKGESKIIASFHDWTGNIRWTSDTLQQKYERADKLGDIIKLSILSTTIYDSHEQALFLRSHASPKPVLAVAMGSHGQLTRALSPISIVTHTSVPSCAPGQLTLSQVHQTLHLAGQLPAHNYFIFGNNIAHSLSPTLHNAAFAELGLPHHYRIHETESVNEEVRNIMAELSFGGASVTFPHKLQIGKYLQALSEPARLIGAVNTVVVKTNTKGERILFGDNTDWLGIKSCIEANWPTPEGVNADAAVIIGAGGASRAACYAVQQLGATKVYLINRTRSKAEELAKDFPGLDFEHFASFGEFPKSVVPVPSVVVGCVPADDITEDDIPAQIFEGARDGGVLVEMAYRPLVTALMKVSERYRRWRTSRGTDVLKEQAYHQFRMWTGRRSPATVMVEAMERAMKN